MDTGRHAESRESQGPSHHPAPAGVEVQLLRSSLARSEWTFRGTRHRAFLLQAGSGLVQSGGVETPIAAPCIVWLPAGRKATLSFEAGSRGASLAVSEVDLGRAIPVGPNATQLRSALAQTIVGAKLPPERARRIADTLGLMEEEARQDQPGAQDAVVHLLAVFLIALWRISRPVLERVAAAAAHDRPQFPAGGGTASARPLDSGALRGLRRRHQRQAEFGGSPRNRAKPAGAPACPARRRSQRADRQFRHADRRGGRDAGVSRSGLFQPVLQAGDRAVAEPASAGGCRKGCARGRVLCGVAMSRRWLGKRDAGSVATRRPACRRP